MFWGYDLCRSFINRHVNVAERYTTKSDDCSQLSDFLAVLDYEWSERFHTGFSGFVKIPYSCNKSPMASIPLWTLQYILTSARGIQHDFVFRDEHICTWSFRYNRHKDKGQLRPKQWSLRGTSLVLYEERPISPKIVFHQLHDSVTETHPGHLSNQAIIPQLSGDVCQSKSKKKSKPVFC